MPTFQELFLILYKPVSIFCGCCCKVRKKILKPTQYIKPINSYQLIILKRYETIIAYKITDKLWCIYGATYASHIIMSPNGMNISNLTKLLTRIKIGLYDKKPIKGLASFNNLQPIRADRIFLTDKETYGEDETKQYNNLLIPIKAICDYIHSIKDSNELPDIEFNNYNIALSTLHRMEPIFNSLISISKAII